MAESSEKSWNSLSEQVFPLNPGLHLQKKCSPLLKHLAPFLHGFSPQGLADENMREININ